MPRLPFLLCLVVLASGAAATALAQDQDTTICHATGSGDHLALTVTAQQLAGHRSHAGDVIPMPAGGCAAIAAQPPTPTPYYDVPGATPIADQPPVPADGPEEDIVDRVEDDAGTEAGGAGVQGAGGGGGLSQPQPVDGLPVTGAEPMLIAMAGLGLLLAGFGLALTVRPSTRP